MLHEINLPTFNAMKFLSETDFSFDMPYKLFKNLTFHCTYIDTKIVM